MKKLLGIVVLGFGLILLNSCAVNEETFKNKYPGFKYYVKACPASNPNTNEACGISARMIEKEARESAIRVCGETYNDCVVVKVNDENVYQQSISKNEKVEMSSMINEAKNTCTSLGFKEGTEKFTDCSLKLYTQKIEILAKNNQKVVQGGNSGVMTIYDPVRDNQRMINQGMKMLRGGCTLGIDC